MIIYDRRQHTSTTLKWQCTLSLLGAPDAARELLKTRLCRTVHIGHFQRICRKFSLVSDLRYKPRQHFLYASAE
jgi:hypothetical protein